MSKRSDSIWFPEGLRSAAETEERLAAVTEAVTYLDAVEPETTIVPPSVAVTEVVEQPEQGVPVGDFVAHRQHRLAELAEEARQNAERAFRESAA